MYKITLSLDAKQLEWLAKGLEAIVDQSDSDAGELFVLINSAKRVAELNDEAARIQAEIHALQNPSVMAKKTAPLRITQSID